MGEHALCTPISCRALTMIPMISKNIYYKDLIVGKILRPLVIRQVAKGGFKSYMKSIGKLGGQNKVPRVSDNRKIADQLDSLLDLKTINS